MRPASFDFARPATIDAAIRCITESGDAMFYCGGTELLLAMKLRVVHAERLVDIKGIPDLDEIALADPSTIHIGARCTHDKIAKDTIVQAHIPALSRLCSNVANIRVRSTGTIGGNLCFGVPHADPPTLLAALGARLKLVGPRGVRMVQADEFIRDELETVREPDELLTHIEVPVPKGPVTYSRFRHGERPSVNVATAWSLEPASGEIFDVRIRVGALGPRPQLLGKVEAILRGSNMRTSSDIADDVLASALAEIEVVDDRYGSAEYKRHLAGVLLRRNVLAAMTEWQGRTR